jgi:recombination endonuclease VII
MRTNPETIRAYYDRRNTLRREAYANPEVREELLAGRKEKYAGMTMAERRDMRGPKVAEYKRKYRLKANFKLSPEQYSEMLSAQGGLCAICRQAEYVKVSNPYMETKVRNLCVDHNHTTGKVRGLLCTLCNGTIGFSRENISHLEACIEYLKSHAL